MDFFSSQRFCFSCSKVEVNLMLNFISSTYSIHISLLTDCSFFYNCVLRILYCSKPTHPFVVVVDLFFSDEGHPTYVTLRRPLSCLPRQTEELEVNNKLSKDNKFKSHQSSKSHYSINIAMRVTTNQTTMPSYCDWQLP